MTIMNAIEIREAISPPDLHNNYRRQLALALDLVSQENQCNLACDYIERVLKICAEVIPDEKRFHQVLLTLRAYLDGKASIEDVARDYQQLFPAQRQIDQSDDPYIRLIGHATWAFVIAINLCCKRELENICVIPSSRHMPKTIDVATKVSYGLARFYGGDDWDADDLEKRKIARVRGHAASENETRWQIEHLIEVMNN